MFLVLGGALGPSFLIFELHLGFLGVLFMYFYSSGAGPWIPFSTFPEKARKRSKKGKEKGAGMGAFQVFPENGKVRFDCAGASGLRFRPLLFLLCAPIFALPFLHRFFEVFGASKHHGFHGFHEVGGRGGTPFNEFN